MPDIEALSGKLFDAVRDYLARSIGPFAERLKAIEARIPERGEKGEKGEKGDMPAIDYVRLAGEYEPPELAECLRFMVQPVIAKLFSEAAASLKGESGKDGEPGKAGEVGPQGIPGERGENGINGKDGAPGDRGPVGESIKGEKGEPGLSVFEIAKSHGFNGSEMDWLLSLRGKDGDRGDAGKDGAPGREGKDGDPGKNALEMAIVMDLDVTRSYPRGTIASHNGGLLCAKRMTGPVVENDFPAAGWRWISNGESKHWIEVDENDPRAYKDVIERADGTRTETVRRIPVPMDKGIYRHGEEHEQGDFVTWDGSLWLALRKTDKAPGTIDWRLAVKRGRDGKDGTMKPNGVHPPVRLG